jgi:transposase
MQDAKPDRSSTPNVALMSMDIAALLRSKDEQIASQGEQIAALGHQIEWFQRQIFGVKSERFIAEPNPEQMYLGQMPVPETKPEQRRTVPAHTRGVATQDGADTGESLKFFDESRLPVRSVHLAHPDAAGKSPDEYEVIGEKITYRLIQNPGSYEVIKYHRPVVKDKQTEL